MTTRMTTHFSAALLGMGLLFVSGCLDGAVAPPDDGASLSYEGYALSADDEADDDFGEDSDPGPLFDALGDATDDGGETLAEGERDAGEIKPEPRGRITRTVLVTWGKPMLDPDAEVATVWSGQIRSDVAFVKPLRKLRFEGRDTVVRDDDPHAVSFATQTRPHHDGLIVRVVVPTDPSAREGSFAFVTDTFTKRIALADLLDGYHETFRADDAGNVLHISTVTEHPCAHGLMRLSWQRRDARGGVFGGLVYNAEGEVRGRIAGIWGKVEGKRRFKGFFVDREGERVGVLKGAFRPHGADIALDGGVFRGVWTVRGGVDGVMGGVYTIGDAPGQGTAQGRWKARCDDRTPCDAERALPEPAAADCVCDPAEDGGPDICDCAARPPVTCVDGSAP